MYFDKVVEDSTTKEVVESGMVRDSQEDKPRFDLISPFALTRLANHYKNGARKYSEYNWAKGGPFSRFYASMFRHMIKWFIGSTDEDHLAAVAWNAFCIMHFEELGMTQFDDRPYKKDNKEILVELFCNTCVNNPQVNSLNGICLKMNPENCKFFQSSIIKGSTLDG